MSEGLGRDGYEVAYDENGEVQIVPADKDVKAPADLGIIDVSSPMTFEVPKDAPAEVKEIALEGGCSAGTAQMEAAARAAGKSDILDQYAADYPQGPHDKPQSMCPAFGSLRVGLRMKRTRRSSVDLPAAFMASRLCRISMARDVLSATFRSIRKPWSRANCSRTFAKRCMTLRTPKSLTQLL